MKIEAQDTFAIVIDYQERILAAMHEKEELLRRSEILVAGLHALDVPMILTTQYAKGLGDNVESITRAMGCNQAIDKNTFSVYANEQVRSAIPRDKRYVILCGIEAHICVLQSMIDLQAAGYQTILVTDCVSSRNPSDCAYALVRAKQEGALITTSEAILYELLGGSAHPAFKTISTLIK